MTNLSTENEEKKSELWKKASKCSKEGKHQEEIDLYNEILKFDPTNWAIWSNKASTYEKLGLEEESKQCHQISRRMMIGSIGDI